MVDPEEWVGGNEGESWDGSRGVYLGDWPTGIDVLCWNERGNKTDSVLFIFLMSSLNYIG